MFATATIFLLVGVAARSLALVAILIAILVADMLTGLVKWSHVVAVATAALILFVFFGYFRSFGDRGLRAGISAGYQSATFDEDPGGLSEFTLMLGKESTAAVIFKSDSDGLAQVLYEAEGVIPSQLLPGKFASSSTADVLSHALLGPSAVASGKGAAGSAVADGFRRSRSLGRSSFRPPPRGIGGFRSPLANDTLPGGRLRPATQSCPCGRIPWIEFSRDSGRFRHLAERHAVFRDRPLDCPSVHAFKSGRQAVARADGVKGRRRPPHIASP